MSDLIFTNARVLDGTQPAQDGMTVVVRGNEIAAVSPNGIDAGPDDRVIDLAGRVLMPGMFQGHTHIDAGYAQPHDYMNIYSRSERPPGVLMARAIKNLQPLLESGITSYIGAACANNNDVQLRMVIEDGLFDGPRITACGRHINTTGHDNDAAKWWYELGYQPCDVFADGPDELMKVTREDIKRGADVVKIFPTTGHGGAGRGRGMTREEIAAVVTAAHDRSKLVRAHCVYREAILECLELGVDIIDHGDEMDERCIEAMVEKGATWVPSMRFLKFLKALPDNVPNLPTGNATQDWDRLCEIVPLANDAGVRILPGDDYGSASFPHRPGIYGEELSMYVNEIGVKPLDVLRWATANGAEVSGNPVGRVAPGLLADLVVVDGDPSADISVLEDADNIQAVLIDGRFVKDRLTAGV